MVKIYTKTGDGGETGLWGGARIPKDDIRIHAYGTIDECNAVLGVARADDLPEQLDKKLERIQNILFVVGADLATPGDIAPAIERISAGHISELESWIDEFENGLEPLKQFILPGGSTAASSLHLARTVCRRAERWASAVARNDIAAGNALKYLNRLSDFLFVAARTANRLAGKPDIKWDNPRLKKK